MCHQLTATRGEFYSMVRRQYADVRRAGRCETATCVLAAAAAAAGRSRVRGSLLPADVPTARTFEASFGA